MKTKIFLLVLFAIIAINLKAQKIEFPTAKFMLGDNPNWSSPSFNDASWKTIKTNVLWQNQGINIDRGFGWMRIHFTLPVSLRPKSSRDGLRLSLAKIDDAGEVFLNGKMIHKTGSFPDEEGGYVTRWNDWNEVILGTDDPALKWGQKNVLAVRIYDGNSPGGIFDGVPFLKAMTITDAVKINNRDNSIVISNSYNVPLTGNVQYQLRDFETNKIVRSVSTPVDVVAKGKASVPLNYNVNNRLILEAKFIEKGTSNIVSYKTVLPYILTPKPSPKPNINSASVFGVRPGSPFLFKIAATGKKPLTYKIQDLPEGLSVDINTGIITGKLLQRGNYKMIVRVENSIGADSQEFTVKVGDLLTLTPPMGWNSWNVWGDSVSDARVRSSAQALLDKGLIDYGWTYINVDQGWQGPSRNAKGQLPSNKRFPDMKGLGNWLHGNGLKFGVYSSPGPQTCGPFLGSYQYEKQDAEMYNSWGVDYLKYDWCHYDDIHKARGDTSLQSYISPYELMGKYLRQQPRDIVYSLCQYGWRNVWEWGAKVDGNLWRTTGDMFDNWESMSSIGFSQNAASAFAGPGRWNDPDMLVIGNVGWSDKLHPTNLTPDEQYTHISLWSLLSAPLLIGCDIASMDEFTFNLLSNNEVIAIDQDELGRPAQRVILNKDYQVWLKYLHDGNMAVGIFNLSEETKTINVNWKELGLDDVLFKVRDLWRQKDLGSLRSIKTKVASHGVTLIKLSK